jgi:HTH-type transcriptional regulator / antitoxin HigA
MTMTTRIPAEAFLPGEFVREEMDARGWTVETLITESGLDQDTVAILIGDEHHPITHDIAIGLSRAFGSSVTFWLNLDHAYTEWVARAQ